MSERRKHYRNKVPGFTSLDINTEGIAKTDNISLGGVKIIVSNDFLVTSMITGEIKLGGKKVKFKGYIGRIDDTGNAGEVGLAIHFVDLSEEAHKTKHSTAIEAAQIAQKANVIKLIIGHFSSRYKDLNILLEETKTVFENTSLAVDGKQFELDYNKENQIVVIEKELEEK